MTETITDKDYLWLLANLYVVLRHGYITSHLELLFSELGKVLSDAAGFPIDSVEPTDNHILDAFRLRDAAPDTPLVRSGPKSKSESKEN